MVEHVRVDFPQRYRRPRVDLKNIPEFRKIISKNKGKLAIIHDGEYSPDSEYTCVRLSDKEPGTDYFYAQMMRGNSLGNDFSVRYRSIEDILIAGETVGFSVDMVMG